MSAHQGTIVDRYAGKQLPEAFIPLLVQNNKSCMGSVVHLNGKLDVSVAELQDMSAEDFSKFLVEYDNTYKDNRVLYFAGNFPKGASGDDIQPFHLITKDNEAVLLGFLEGPFPSFADDKSVHSNHFNAAARYLKPKAEQFWEMVGQDVERLMKALDNDLVRTEMLNIIGESGSIILIGSNGKVIPYVKQSAKQLSGEWGWASNHHGFAPAIASVPAAPAQKVNPFLKKKSEALSSTAPAPAVVAPPQTDPPKEEPKLDPAVKEPINIGALPEGITYDPASKKFFGKCPDRIKSKDERRKWFMENCGFCPENYKKMGPAAVKVEVRGGAFEMLAKRINGNGAVAPSHTTSPDAPQSERKDTAPHNKPTLTVQNKSAEKLPVVPVEAVDNFKKWMQDGMIQGIVEKHGVADPATFQSFEEKYPSFTDRTEISLEKTFNWPYEFRYLFAKNHPELFALLSMNKDAAYARLLLAEAKASERAAKEETQQQPVESKATGTDGKPAHVNPFLKKKTISGEPKVAVR